MAVLLGFLLIFVGAGIGALFIMWGWSLFMVPVAEVSMITFSQAFGLAILAQTLVKGTSATVSK